MTEPERIALITGANRGLGLEVARQLGAMGFRVLLGVRDSAKAAETADRLRGDGIDAVALPLDVADAESIVAAAAIVARDQPRLDVLINNAAIHYDTWQRAITADFATVDEAWRTNLMGPWRLTNALLPSLRTSSAPRVVNVSSESGSLASMGAGTPAYHVTKAALNALTRTMAAELRSEGFLVNAICPGWTATDMGGGGGRPVAVGAKSIVWAATLPDDGPTGGFFRDGRPVPW
ncbi:MAG: SDR family oxidoreductase [Pseudomonadota bacterium]